jgi:hypothetical protein
VQFTRGALYNVGSDSQYGEMEFSLELTLQVTNQFQQFGVPNVPIHWDVKAMSAAEFPDFGSVKFSSPIDESWILDTSNAFNSFNVASAVVHSRFTVAGEIPNARDVSTIESPPKKRISTIWACLGSKEERRVRASSRANRSNSVFFPAKATVPS